MNIIEHLNSVLDFIHGILVYEFKTSTFTKRRAYFNVLCCAFFCFILSRIPLETGEAYTSITTFHVSNSWMHIGFRPYMCIYFLGYWLENDRYKRNRLRVLYLILSLFFLIDKSWIVCGILMSVSLCMVQMDAWLSKNSSIPLNTLLLLIVFCRDHCLRPLAWVGLFSIICLNLGGITLPMVHMKRRLQPQSAKIPLFYHGGGPLIMYVRIVELLAMFWSPIGDYLLSSSTFFIICGAELLKCCIVYIFSQYWAKWYKKTGFDLAKHWQKQRFTLKGWRSTSSMGKHIDRLIQRNIKWDILLTCVHSLVCVCCSIRPVAVWMSISTMRQIKEAAN